MKNLNLFFGQLFLVLLALTGLLAITFLVPQISLELATRYSEFSNDELIIRVLLTMPIVIAIAVFLEVMYLQRLVHLDRMSSSRAYKWVKLLTITPLVLAASFVFIGLWLSWNKALPPFYFFTLLALSVFSLAVSAVTHSLLGLLRRATSASEELEGVV
jgi:hypothetical protein